jgi:hypothetical protein
VLVSAGVLCFTQSALADTLTVDDDHADCPAAAFSSIQAAVDAAAPGDTVTVCPGEYAEGSGAVGTNALTISKSLTLKGAGADLVKITPKSSGPAYGQIMEGLPDLRNGLGDVVAVVGTPSQPLDVEISGVTVDGWDPQGRPVAVEAGILFLDAEGEVARSRVTNVVTSEGDNAYLRAGGYRGEQPGIGIAQVTRALYAPVDGARQLRIERTRVDKYNQIGVLIDGAQNDTPPLTPSGAVDWGVIHASQIVGRTLCIDYRGTGECSLIGGNGGGPGGPRLSTGPLFGQDGLRVTAGSYATVEDSTITQNHVLGEGAPVPGSETDNANLTLGAGVRYIGARMNDESTGTGRVNYSHIATSNIMNNAYGAINVELDGTTPAEGEPNADSDDSLEDLLVAENNWWGLYDLAATNPGPAISPTTNPRQQENPVNGIPVTEDATGATISESVDFFPFRDGSQGHPTRGQFPVLTAPLPVDDYAPTISLSAPATARRGETITLTAGAGDDFGVKRVRFAEGAATTGTATLPPYTQSVTIPRDARCGSTRSYAAVVTDSLGQTASDSKSVAVRCSNNDQPEPEPEPQPTSPAAPSIAWLSWPSPLRGSGDVTVAPSAPAGLRSVAVFLGGREVCALTAAPFSCSVEATGADVGGQALRAVVTDALGATAEIQRSMTVARFHAPMRLKIHRKKLSGKRLRRTISGRLRLPDAVTRAQGCKGSVTLVIKRGDRSVLDEQVRLSRKCTFKRSVTAARRKQSFSASARFAGNAVLSAARKTRRFS